MTVPVNHLFGSREGWHWIPSGGIRFNSHSDFEDTWAPQAGVVAGYKDTQIHARYAYGVNYPGVYAVFLTENSRNGGDSWKILEPETVDHFEIGISSKFADWIKPQATAFWDFGNDRLVFVAPPTWEELVRRLRGRHSEGEVEIAKRVESGLSDPTARGLRRGGLP